VKGTRRRYITGIYIYRWWYLYTCIERDFFERSTRWLYYMYILYYKYIARRTFIYLSLTFHQPRINHDDLSTYPRRCWRRASDAISSRTSVEGGSEPLILSRFRLRNNNYSKKRVWWYFGLYPVCRYVDANAEYYYFRW